ncbi:hypothetical protein HDC93_000612 [Streptomyces sp. AK010]|nr:hypothetical protein [Streptomyces sp. AK010]
MPLLNLGDHIRADLHHWPELSGTQTGMALAPVAQFCTKPLLR